MDMSQFIVAKSDQLNADDLAGGPITVTIERVTGNDSADQPVSVHYVGDGGKPYKPCKSMRRVMVHVWGLDAKQYAGKSMTLRRDPEVMFGGMKVGGIRITHMSGIDSERSMALNATRGKKALYKVLPLKDAPQQSTAQRDFSAELAQLKAVAAPGNTAALQDKWQEIGPDARKALAGELGALKAACDQSKQSEPSDDVPFDDQPQQQTTGGGYEGV
jgi:hypothetical protein